MPNLVPVTFARHGLKQLLPRTSWTFAARQQATSLLVSEFPVAAHHLPIVFVKMNEKFVPAALLGLKPGENALVDGQGQWRGEYVPAILRRHPFVLIRKEQDSSEFVLCVDEDGGMLADSGGEPLFTADGQQAPALEQVAKVTSDHLAASAAGEQLTALLTEHGLLAPLQVQDRNRQRLPLEGVCIVDEKKFNDLSDEVFLRLRAAGMLPAIYAHFFSLAQLNRLARMVN